MTRFVQADPVRAFHVAHIMTDRIADIQQAADALFIVALSEEPGDPVLKADAAAWLSRQISVYATELENINIEVCGLLHGCVYPEMHERNEIAAPRGDGAAGDDPAA